MKKTLLTAIAVAFAGVGSALAAVQVGGNASIVYDIGGSIVPGSGTVGAGTDIVISFLEHDVDANGGTQLVATSTSPSWNFTNNGDPVVTMTVTFDLVPGTSLVGFNLDTITFPGASASVANNVLTITFTDTDGGQIDGVWLSGTYVFDGGAPIPVPAAALLFAPLAAAAVRRRRKA